jgi:hypothetical protein
MTDRVTESWNWKENLTKERDELVRKLEGAKAEGRREAFEEAEGKWQRVDFSADFANWLREKAAGFSADFANWLREKAAGFSADFANWLREKAAGR